VDDEYARKLKRDLFREFESSVQIVLTEDLDAKSNPLVSLKRELQSADLVVTLLTPLAVKSGHMLEQLGGAWALEKQILPVVTKREVLNGLPQSVVESPLLIQVGNLADSIARDKVVKRVKQARDSALMSVDA